MESKFEIYNRRVCAICGINGGLKKWFFYFGSNRKAKVCRACANRLTPPGVVEWLESHAIYNKRGALIGFKKDEGGEL
jgi:hypothetical protein